MRIYWTRVFYCVIVFKSLESQEKYMQFFAPINLTKFTQPFVCFIITELPLVVAMNIRVLKLG